MRKLLFALPLVLAGCAQVSAPEPTTSQATAATPPLHAAGNLSGQTFTAGALSLKVAPGALAAPASITVTPLPLSRATPIPPINNVFSAFIMREVVGARPVAVWRVQAQVSGVQGAASLAVAAPQGLQAQGLRDDVTEIFERDNLRGTDTLVGTYRGDVPLEISDLADRLAEVRGGVADFTYSAYRSTWDRYAQACAAQQGDVELGYCSFRNKQVAAPAALQAQAPLQYRRVRFLSWNIGNVAYSCNAYQNKVCYQTTERRISDQVLALEQSGGRFDYLFLQELWHGQCDQTGIAAASGSSNPRLCDAPTRGTHSIGRILGSRYATTCTQAGYEQKGYVNGYECMGIDQNRYTIVNSALYGTPQGYHPYCASNPSNGVDTGFQVIQTTLAGGSSPLTMVNVHLAGTTSSECRATQLDALANSLRSSGSLSNLIAGDFNTEPFNDSTAGGVAFRRAFKVAGRESEAPSPVAALLDAGTTPSAFYVWGSPALDHVLSNTFRPYQSDERCTFGGNFNGTDHTWMDCRLSVYTAY